MKKAILQVALDLLELNGLCKSLKRRSPGGADWIEAGTPLIKSEGMQAIRALREQFPNTVLVADMKIAEYRLHGSRDGSKSRGQYHLHSC